MPLHAAPFAPFSLLAAALRRGRSGFLERPYSVPLAILLVVLATQFLGRRLTEWDYCYVATAQNLLKGTDIYAAKETGWTYPPFPALLGVPVAGLPKLAARAAWYLLNAAALVYLLRAAWRLTGGGPIRFARDPREHAVLWIGLCIGFPYALNCLAHQQSDIVIGALVVGGVDLLRRGRSMSAGVAFGLAAAMKCTPLLFVPYLLLRGRFAAAGVVLAVAAAASLAPDLIARPPAGGVWAGRWFDEYIAPLAAPDYTPGVWASNIIYNQSFVGLSNRWTHTVIVVEGRKAVVVEVPPTLGPSDLKLILLGLAAVCGTLGLVAVLTGRRHAEPDATVNGAGLVVAGMLLFSPMSSPAHFGLLLLPGFALGRAAVRGHRWAWPLVAVAVAAGVAANKDLVGEPLYTLTLWYGLPTWGTVACLFGSIASLAARPEPERRQ